MPADRLELDHVLAEAALAGIHDLLDLGDQRLRARCCAAGRCRPTARASSRRRTEQDGLDRGAAVRSAALNEQECCARCRRASCLALTPKPSSSLQHGLRRDVVQRHHGDALAGLRGRRPVDAAGADRLGGRHAGDMPPRSRTSATLRHPQRVFEHVEQVGLRHRATRGQRHRALHARIDGVADAENVAEDDLGDRRDRRVLEIQIDSRRRSAGAAAAARCAAGDAVSAPPKIDRARRFAAPRPMRSTASWCGERGRMSMARTLVGDILRTRIRGSASIAWSAVRMQADSNSGADKDPGLPRKPGRTRQQRLAVCPRYTDATSRHAPIRMRAHNVDTTLNFFVKI